MRFSVQVMYLFEEYTYEITTLDESHFRCSRIGRMKTGKDLAPPEELLLTLGEEPQPEVWGKPPAALYRELLYEVNRHLRNGRANYN